MAERTRRRRVSRSLRNTSRISRSRTPTPRAASASSRAGLNLQVNVNGRQIAPTDYEIDLLLEGGAGEGANVVFKFELHYAGVFRIENIPADQVQPLAMIEGPRLLFPFARQIIADAVRNGGYPPLYVDPIDFHRLYMQRLQAAGRRGAGERLAFCSPSVGRRVAAPNRRFAERIDQRGVRVALGLDSSRSGSGAGRVRFAVAIGPSPRAVSTAAKDSERWRPPVSSP